MLVREEVARFDDWLGSLDVVPTISALRRRGDEIVEQVLRENESRWESLSEADRERVETMARAVVSRLLHEPTRACAAPRARARPTATCTPCASCSGSRPPWRRTRRRPPRSPSSTRAASAAAGDPARHARQRARAGAGAAGGRAAAGRGGARADHDLGRPAQGSDPVGPRAAADKSRFVKEIEEALLAGEIDLAVHSAKDVPAELPRRAALVGVPERADARDALCGADSLDDLPEGAVVGTRACAAAPHCSLCDRTSTCVTCAATSTHACGASPTATSTRSCSRRPASTGWAAAARARRSTPRFVPAPGQGCLAAGGARDADEAADQAAARSPTATRSPA